MEQLRYKVLLALLALAVAFGSASVANAQVVLTQTSANLQVRAEGRAETMGAVVLTNNGAAGTIANLSSISITYPGTIINLGSGATAFGTSYCNTGTAASILTLGATFPAPTSCIRSGRVLTLSYSSGAGVGVATGDSVTVTGIRVDVASTGSSTGTILNAPVSSTAPSAAPISFAVLSRDVATANASLSAVITVPAAPPVGILTCAPPVGPIPPFVPAVFTIRVRERFAAALTSIGDENALSTAGSAGGAPTGGTTIVFTFTNVPKGLEISWDALAADGARPLPTVTGPVEGALQEATTAGQTLTFTFTVTGTDTGQLEGGNFSFSAGDANGDLALGAATVTATVSIGPIANTAGLVVPIFPVVSFATNNEGGGAVIAVSDCVTNILFPFVANAGGFDTGIAIANTSQDPFGVANGGAVAQAGTCKLSGFPGPITATTPSIAAGATFLGSLGDASPATLSPFNGFVGYIISVCQFQNAHAFAFIVDGYHGVRTIAEGYVALIIPNTTLVPRSPAGGGAGEALGE